MTENKIVKCKFIKCNVFIKIRTKEGLVHLI